MIDNLFDYLTKAAAVPREAWAPVLGLLSAWSLTQRLKFLLPASWSSKAREVSTQATAFVIGMIVTAVVFGPLPGLDKSQDPTSWFNPLGWAVGFVVGLAAPLIWNAGMLVLGWWKPELAKTLSQSVRKDP